jgi:hypothetical protein
MSEIPTANATAVRAEENVCGRERLLSKDDMVFVGNESVNMTFHLGGDPLDGIAPNSPRWGLDFFDT